MARCHGARRPNWGGPGRLSGSGDPGGIRNFQRLGPCWTTSGRLRAEDLDGLAVIGVAHVINFALDDHPEALADEAGQLAARGIGYSHIPVPFDAPGEAHYAAFVAALEGAGDAPVHVHCIMNYRVSAFFYRYHREVLGMAEPEARVLMTRHWNPLEPDRAETRAWARFLNG